MENNNKIYIAGHNGMVGSAILRKLKANGFNKLIFHSHADLDLLIQSDVNTFFKREKPDIVILAAAKVGGINANNTYRGQFLYENLTIQNNVIHAAHEFKVKKLLFLGSACIYPKEAIQPIKEEYLLSNYLESTNEPYAIAKIAGIKLCENYYNQYGDNFISIMPNNLYGPNDNFNLQTSHVLPALLRKFHEGKQLNSNFVEIWGTGSPLREFIHVDDMADACLYLMNNIDADELYNIGISHINIGSGEEVSIKELAIMIKKVIDYNGNLVFNPDYPDGTPRKLLDVSRLNAIGWKSKIKLEDGLKSVYEWYLDKLLKD
jgi:GDP-L-fucose synthase